MAEKKSEKKLLAILVVLVAVSLVVDLLSLNVLYNVADESGLKGSLATSSGSYNYPDDPYRVRYRDAESGCEEVVYLDSVDSCMRDCFRNLAACKFDACVEEFNCEEDGYAMPGFCSSQLDLEEQTCEVRYENCKGSNC